MFGSILRPSVKLIHAAHVILVEGSSQAASGTARTRCKPVGQARGPATKSVALKAPRLARLTRRWVAGRGRNLNAGPMQSTLGSAQAHRQPLSQRFARRRAGRGTRPTRGSGASCFRAAAQAARADRRPPRPGGTATLVRCRDRRCVTNRSNNRPHGPQRHCAVRATAWVPRAPDRSCPGGHRGVVCSSRPSAGSRAARAGSLQPSGRPPSPLFRGTRRGRFGSAALAQQDTTQVGEPFCGCTPSKCPTLTSGAPSPAPPVSPPNHEGPLERFGDQRTLRGERLLFSVARCLAASLSPSASAAARSDRAEAVSASSARTRGELRLGGCQVGAQQLERLVRVSSRLVERRVPRRLGVEVRVDRRPSRTAVHRPPGTRTGTHSPGGAWTSRM